MNRFNQTIECGAVRVGGNSSWSNFVVSATPSGGSKTKLEELKFSLYPQKSENEFLDTRVNEPLTDKSHTHSIYFAPQYTDSGIRFQKPICWIKMLDAFTEVVKSAKLGSISVTKEDGTLDSISVIASLSML